MLEIALFVVGMYLATAIILFFIGERLTIRPSTWRVVREYGLWRFLNLNTYSTYIYGRFVFPYIKMLIHVIWPHVGSRGRKWFTDRYHAKVLTHEHAHAIINNKKEIPLQDLEQIIPYPTARKLVLNASPDIVALECPCRHARKKHCKPTQVCMVIGKLIGDAVQDYHPERSRRITRTEALKLLKEEYMRGHIHTAWFRDIMLDRFWVLCNCCKCCCGGIEMMVRHGAPMLTSSGYVAKVNKALCIACGTCAKVCPFRAIGIESKKAVINWDKCMGCGVCEAKCPKGAVKLKRDKKKGIPLDVRTLHTKK